MSRAAEPTVADGARPRRVFERFVFWPLVAVLASASAELGFRAVLIARGSTYVDSVVEDELHRILRENERAGATQKSADAASSDFQAERLLQPFFAFDTRDGLAQIDQRIADLRETSGDSFDVLVLGGSVANTACSLGGRHLMDRLEKSPRFAGKKPRLWNFARNDFKQPQELEFLLYLTALGAKPEVVIEVDGRNEILIGTTNASSGTHPIFPSLRAWGPLAFGGATDRDSLDSLIEAGVAKREIQARCERLLAGELHCALLAGAELRSIASSIERRNAAFEKYRRRSDESAQHAVIAGPSFQDRPDLTLGACVNIWRETTRSMSDVCKARGIRFLEIIEPFGVRTSVTPESERLAERLLLGREGLKQVGRKLASNGVEVIDALDVLPEKREATETAMGIVDAIADRLEADPSKR